MANYWISVVELVGGIHALFVAVVLVYLPGRNPAANRMLALFMVLLANTLVFESLMISMKIDALFPRLIFLEFAMLFLIGPCFWLYLVRLTGIGNRDLSGTLGHFVPFALAMLFYMPVFFSSSQKVIEAFEYGGFVASGPVGVSLSPVQKWLGFVVHSNMLLLSIQLGSYVIATFNLVRQHSNRLSQQFSYTEKVNLNWVKYLVSMVTILWLALVADEILFKYQHDWFGMVEVVGRVTLVFVVSFFGLLQPRIFLSLEAYEGGKNETPADVVDKYRNSPLTEEQANKILQDLLNLMQEKKPYLNNLLILNDVAVMINLPARQVSQVINERCHRNFLEFVNEYRIEEAKTLLEQNPSTSVLDIALQSGFNSKSAFYQTFKRYTNMTPSAFRKQVNLESPKGSHLVLPKK